MTLLLVGVVLAGIVVLTPLADRIRVPQPILLLVFGLLVALVPGLPALDVDADLILPVVLPPLLFAATQRTTFQAFRDAAAPVLLLAVGLTVVSATIAAVVAHLAGLPWVAAAVLGAIVSPPDPVAATAVARRLRLPERMVTILEGEGMFNDATALVLYKVALAVAVTGEFSALDSALELVLAVVAGVGLGLVLGWATNLLLGRLDDAGAETLVTLAVPFIAYLGAERLDGSGVLAVLVLGLFLRQRATRAFTSQGWLLGRSVWDFADFVVTSIVFVLLGFELTSVLVESRPTGRDWLLVVAVLGTLVVLRPLWIFPASAVARAVARRRASDLPYGWRETLVVSWAGMRGVVTVATALALPVTGEQGDLGWRTPVVLVALVVVLATLVAQGLTLSPLVVRLGVGSESDDVRDAADLRCRALEAALDRLRSDGDAEGDEEGDPVRAAAVRIYEGRLEAQRVVRRAVRGQPLEDDAPPEGERSGDLEDRLRDTLEEARSVERDLVLRARTSGEVAPATADDVLREIEGRAARAGGA